MLRSGSRHPGSPTRSQRPPTRSRASSARGQEELHGWCPPAERLADRPSVEQLAIFGDGPQDRGRDPRILRRDGGCHAEPHDGRGAVPPGGAQSRFVARRDALVEVVDLGGVDVEIEHGVDNEVARIFAERAETDECPVDRHRGVVAVGEEIRGMEVEVTQRARQLIERDRSSADERALHPAEMPARGLGAVEVPARPRCAVEILQPQRDAVVAPLGHEATLRRAQPSAERREQSALVGEDLAPPVVPVGRFLTRSPGDPRSECATNFRIAVCRRRARARSPSWPTRRARRRARPRRRSRP